MAKYLDSTGLTQVWNKAKDTFLSKGGGTISGNLTISYSSGYGIYCKGPSSESSVEFLCNNTSKAVFGAQSSSAFIYNRARANFFRYNDNGTLTFEGNTVWHAGNDGASSGLDADLLDGIHASSFVLLSDTGSNGNLLRKGGISNINNNSLSYDYETDIYTIVSNTGQSRYYGSGVAIRDSAGYYVRVPFGYHYRVIVELYFTSAHSLRYDQNNRAWGVSVWNGNDNDTNRVGPATTAIPENSWTTVMWGGANLSSDNTSKADLVIQDCFGPDTGDDAEQFTWYIRRPRIVIGKNNTWWSPCDDDNVHLYGDQTISGTKTFSSNLYAPTVYQNGTKVSVEGHTHTLASLGAASSSHNHDGVYSPISHNHDNTYLKLSGGTITNTSSHYPLTIKGTSDYSLIEFRTNGNVFRKFGIKSNGELITTSVSDWSSEYIILHSGNYTSYTVKKDGTGASGTWGINVSGSAGSVPWSGVSSKPDTATRWPAWSEVTSKPESFTPTAHDHGRLNTATITEANLKLAQYSGFYNVSPSSSSEIPGATSSGNVCIHAAWDNGSNTAGLDLLINDSQTSPLYFRSRVGGNGIGSWRTILDSSNWSTYCAAASHTHSYLPLSGGTLTGNVAFDRDSSITWSRNSDTARISFKNASDADSDSYMWFQTSDNGNEYFRWSHNSGSDVEWMTLKSDGLRIKGNLTLHAGNYSDYTVTKTGSGASGTWGINITGNAATATTASSANNATWSSSTSRLGYYNGIRGSGGNSQGKWIKFATLSFNENAWQYFDEYLCFGGVENSHMCPNGILRITGRASSTTSSVANLTIVWISLGNIWYRDKIRAYRVAEDNVYDLYISNYSTYISPIYYRFSIAPDRLTLYSNTTWIGESELPSGSPSYTSSLSSYASMADEVPNLTNSEIDTIIV